MMKVAHASFGLALVALLLIGRPPALAASEQLDRAKELYRTAAYDEALTVLEGLSTVDSDEAIEVHEYRVLCLVALDRRDDARTAMAALVGINPSYAMSESEASPRVRTMFAEVRRSHLPNVIQRAYSEAKASFDRKDSTALTQFERVLTLLKDPDIAGHAALADLATVAAGFRDLSKALVATAPIPPAGPAAAPEPPRPATATASVIVPPVVVSQPVPIPQLREEREWNGEIEVTINERGRVIATRMTRPIHPVYDQQLLRAALSWAYKPALRDGSPVSFTRLITVNLDTRPLCTGRSDQSCRAAAAGR